MSVHTFLLTATCYDLDFFSQFFWRKFLISLMKKPEDFEIGIEEELEICLCSFIWVFIYMYLGVFTCAFIFLTRFGVKQKSK
jgi:hypothetical protein